MVKETIQFEKKDYYIFHKNDNTGSHNPLMVALTEEEAKYASEITTRNYHKIKGSDHNVRIVCYKTTFENAKKLNDFNKKRVQTSTKLEKMAA